MRAGAHTVMASRAQLDLDATLALARAVMRGIVSEGRSPAEAMRRARREVSAQSRWAHPYYHALMQVLGVGQVPIFAPAILETPIVDTAATSTATWWRAVGIAGSGVALGILIVLGVLNRRWRARRSQ